MKKILRNNYYLMAVSWGLLLRNKALLALLVSYVSCYYLYAFSRQRNMWRISAVFLLNNAAGIFLLRFSTLPAIYRFLPSFLVSVSLNAALLNDFLLGVRLKVIYPSYLLLLFCAAVFTATALLVPVSLYEYFGMINIYLLIVLIFSPYILVNTCVMIRKEMRNYDLRMRLVKNKG